MARVLLGQSYYLRFDPKLWKGMQPYPPLGTLYAASYLRSRGFSPFLFDAMLAESSEEWDQALDRIRPQFAVLYEDSFNYLSKMCLLRMREAAFRMIRVAKSSGCTVILSGSDATDHRDRYFRAGADYILVGEGEMTLGELLGCLTDRSTLREPESIPGVASADRLEGPLRPRPLLRDLDSLPYPAWDLVDLPRYRGIWRRHHGFFSINMVTTRGCPYQCNWCAKPIYGQRYHSRSPENVVSEMAWLRQHVAPDHIWFADDIFGLKRGWIERFSGLVCEAGLQTPFKCLLRTDLVNPEVARLLRRAGCRTVWMGAESGSQKILDAMQKGATVEDTYRSTRELRKAGIEVGYFLQFGYPGEEWEDVRWTIRMVRDNLPDDIGISVSYPLPGTSFHDRVRKDLKIQQNWIDSNDLAMFYRGPFSPDFYRRLHRTVHKEYRAFRGWNQLRRGDWRGGRPMLRAFTLPLDYLRLRQLRNPRNRPRL